MSPISRNAKCFRHCNKVIIIIITIKAESNIFHLSISLKENLGGNKCNWLLTSEKFFPMIKKLSKVGRDLYFNKYFQELIHT